MFDHKKILIGVTVLFAAYLVDYFFIHAGEHTTLDLKHGKLRGSISLSRGGREYYEFLGIPYAEAPVGKLRFLSPKPAKPWSGVRDATSYASKCMQVDTLTNIKGGSEDCLYLNVFSPKATGMPALRPVIVYIHGGDFMTGDAKSFGPKYFMDEEVVLVTLNYRLGSLGFLNAANKYARGNMGLKDQVLALRWVQENIASFSGDPKRVVLYGQGSGGTSVHLHMLSKVSSGLFMAGVSASGTALSPSVLQRNSTLQAKRLGRRLRCPTLRKSEAMVACLGQAEVGRLVEGQREAVHFLHDPLVRYGPTVETHVGEGEEPFLTKDPVFLVNKGKVVNKVPWVVGVNSDEGLAAAATIYRNSSMTAEVDSRWSHVLPNMLLYNASSSDSSVDDKIKTFYFGPDAPESHFISRASLAQLFGDRMAVVPALNSVASHAKSAPVYLYHFAQPSPSHSYADVVFNQAGFLPPVVQIGVYVAYKWVMGLFTTNSNLGVVSHFDDQAFLFNNIPFMVEVKDEVSLGFSKDLVSLWVGFAKEEGKMPPFRGVSWSSAANQESKVLLMELSAQSSKIVENPFKTRADFWNSLNLSPR